MHPDVVAALNRDGVSLAAISELVGIGRPTLLNARLDGPTEERAKRYRALDAWIDGRSRAVEYPGETPRWRLEPVPPGSTPDEVRDVAADVEDAARALQGNTPGNTGNGGVAADQAQDRIIYGAAGLRSAADGIYPPAMTNALVVQSIAAQVNARGRGRWVNYLQKVPPDFRPRIHAAAKKAGVSPSDFIRVLVEINTEPVDASAGREDGPSE